MATKDGRCRLEIDTGACGRKVCPLKHENRPVEAEGGEEESTDSTALPEPLGKGTFNSWNPTSTLAKPKVFNLGWKHQVAYSYR